MGLAGVLAAALLVVPRTAALAGLLGLLLMVGAVGSHLTTLGIEVAGDGGVLFAMALVTLVATAGVAILRRGRLPVIGPRLARGVPGA